MTPQTARAAADAGVDFVSAGAITHSIRAIDIALDVDTRDPKKEKRISLKVKKAGRPARNGRRPMRRPRTRTRRNFRSSPAK
jgi:hypothetical protein